jgi:hypothetical protein
MKILYKPFAIVAAILGARLGRSVFKSVWAQIDAAQPPPSATTGNAGLGKVVGAAALEAATMAGTKAAVNRASARYFHFVTGIWPGEKPAKPPAA